MITDHYHENAVKLSNGKRRHMINLYILFTQLFSSDDTENITRFTCNS